MGNTESQQSYCNLNCGSICQKPSLAPENEPLDSKRSKISETQEVLQNFLYQKRLEEDQAKQPPPIQILGPKQPSRDFLHESQSQRSNNAKLPYLQNIDNLQQFRQNQRIQIVENKIEYNELKAQIDQQKSGAILDQSVDSKEYQDVKIVKQKAVVPDSKDIDISFFSKNENIMKEKVCKESVNNLTNIISVGDSSKGMSDTNNGPIKSSNLQDMAVISERKGSVQLSEERQKMQAQQLQIIKDLEKNVNQMKQMHPSQSEDKPPEPLVYPTITQDSQIMAGQIHRAQQVAPVAGEPSKKESGSEECVQINIKTPIEVTPNKNFSRSFQVPMNQDQQIQVQKVPQKQNSHEEKANINVNRHQSIGQSVDNLLPSEKVPKQSKFLDDLNDISPKKNFFEIKQNENMTVHDCKSGQHEDDVKSEYTYVSVSNMSNNIGNSTSIMSPEIERPIHLSKEQQSKKNSDYDSPQTKPEPIRLENINKIKSKKGASLFASLQCADDMIPRSFTKKPEEKKQEAEEVDATNGTMISIVPQIVVEEKVEEEQDNPLGRDSIINPININLKQLFIFKGFQNYESGQQNVSSKKQASRWQSLQENHDNIDVLNKVVVDYEPISLLSTSQYGETYLVKIRGDKKQKKDKKKKKKNKKKETTESDEKPVEEYHILKIIDKSKFLKKEKAFVMRQVRAMMHVDHPTISCYTHFFMSTDYFYYLSKLRLKVGQKKEFQQQVLPSLQNNAVQSQGQNSSPNLDLLIKSFSGDNIPEEDTKQVSLNIANQVNFENSHALQQHLSSIKQLEKTMPLTLSQALIYHRKSLSAKQVANIAKELLLSIQYIHSKDIIHLNLNPCNILVLRSDPESFFNNDPIEDSSDDDDESSNHSVGVMKSNILLSNFCQASQYTKKIKFTNQEHTPIMGGRIEKNEDGSIKEKNTSKYQSGQQQICSFSDICYMSPERITGNIKTEDVELNKRSDMWSIGVIIYVLFSGQLPFFSETCQELYEDIKRSEFMFPGSEWENVPQSAKQLIQEMLRQDPIDRIDSALAINHQFFLEANQDNSRNFQGNSLILQNNWAQRSPRISKNIELMFSKLDLTHQIYLYHSFLQSNANLIQTFLNTFSQELSEIQQVEQDQTKNTTSEMMQKASTLNLTFEQAEKGLSNIMGDIFIARWFLKQVQQAKQQEDLTLKELIEFYLELFLGKLDYELQVAYEYILNQIKNPYIHVKECLRMALSVNMDNLLSIQEGGYKYFKQLIYLHSMNEIHAALREGKGLHAQLTDLIFGNNSKKLVKPDSIVWSQGPASNQVE